MKGCRTCGRFFEDDAFEACPEDGSELKPVAGEVRSGRDPLVGRVIDGRFRITELLGKGGMGAVYRAEQTSVERAVALKVIAQDVTEDLAKRFMLEARMTSRLQNVHTVTIFDFGQDADATLYLAMELLEGEPLDRRLKSLGRLSWRRALGIVAQVAESLAEAHGKSIVHRDLKPANVYLTSMGDDPDFVKVMDFGVAKAVGDSHVTNLTGTGMIVGTPAYMAPEQARSEPVDGRADVYALGVMLYEMLTGVQPFRGDSPVSILMKHCQDPVPPLEAQEPPPEVPEGVRALVMAMLAKSCEERVDSAGRVRERARALLDEAPGEASAAAPSASSEIVAEPAREAPVEPALDGGMRATTPDAPPGVVEPSPASGASAAEAPRGTASELTSPGGVTGSVAPPGATGRRWGPILGVAGIALAGAVAGALVTVQLVGDGATQQESGAARVERGGEGRGGPASPAAGEEDASGGSGRSSATGAATADPTEGEGQRAEGEARRAAGEASGDASTGSRTRGDAGARGQPDDAGEAEAVAVRVASEPTEARVARVSGEELGRTPLSVPLEEGAAHIRVRRDGYEPETLELEPDAEEPVTVVLEPKEEGAGEEAEGPVEGSGASASRDEAAPDEGDEPAEDAPGVDDADEDGARGEEPSGSSAGEDEASRPEDDDEEAEDSPLMTY